MTTPDVLIVREEDPMVVLKEQKDLVARTDPGYWNARSLKVEMFILERYPDCPTFGTLGFNIAQGDTPRGRLGERRLSEGDIRFLDIANVLSTGIDFTGCSFILPSQHERLSRTALKERDVLFIQSGVGSLGRSTVVTSLPGPTNVTSHIDVIRPKQLSPFYVALLLMTKFGQLQIERRKSGVSGREEIPITRLRTILIPRIVSAGGQLESVLESNYLQMSQYHQQAMDAKENMVKAQQHDNKAAEERYHAEYEHNLTIAEAMLNDLVRQVEEIIEGTRTEIESVDRVLNEEQGSGA